MKEKLVIALVAAGALIPSATASSPTKGIVSASIIERGRAATPCRVAYEGKKLYVISAAGVEVYEQENGASMVDFTGKPFRILRGENAVTVLSSSGVIVYQTLSPQQTHKNS